MQLFLSFSFHFFFHAYMVTICNFEFSYKRRAIRYPLATNFASEVDASTGIVESFKYLHNATAHPQFSCCFRAASAYGRLPVVIVYFLCVILSQRSKDTASPSDLLN